MATPLRFTVDTALFRQLGELLVGRDATALVELVKNAYDADATKVILDGSSLDDPEVGVIRILDNGLGMNASQFSGGFLRLAARRKGEGVRRSRLYGRKYTGEKGVGRLAAHKLGGMLEVESLASELDADLDLAGATEQVRTSRKSLIQARIDWDRIELVETLEAITDELSLKEFAHRASLHTGTDIKISKLRHAWTGADLSELSRQIRNFEPPPSLVTPLRRGVANKLIFGSPSVRDSGADDPGMKVELQGDFSHAEEHWGSVEKSAEWVLEIRAVRGELIRYSVSPTVPGLRANPFGRAASASMPHPSPDVGPFFDARIFLRPGVVPSVERDWAQANSGVRVYVEGFRVLPYGEPGNDWLALDFDYTRRSGRVDINPLAAGPSDDLAAMSALGTRDVNLRLQPNRNFFGAVFLTDQSLGGLKTLVNREGFVPDRTFERLVSTVRTGLNFLHRSWALAGFLQKQADLAAEAERLAAELAAAAAEVGLEAEQSGKSDDDDIADELTDPDVDPAAGESAPPPEGRQDEELDNVPFETSRAQGSGARLLAALERLRLAEELPPSESRGRWVEANLNLADVAAKELMQDTSLMRVLASVGSQLASFSHEVGHLLAVAGAAEEALKPKAGERWPPRAAEGRRVVGDLRAAIARQASYLVDVSSSDARRRRARLDLRERVEIAMQALETQAAQHNIELVNGVVGGHRTPPMYKAELQSILSNLLSNAIKAAGKDGQVELTAESLPEELVIALSNTGDQVDLSRAESLFQPFVSNSIAIDPVLGQGMGLGLQITRGLLAEYGGRLEFVKPRSGFATTIAAHIPK